MDKTEQDGGEVARQLDLSSAGPDALADPERAVRRLQDVQAARVALATVGSEDVRRAITQRRTRLTELGRHG